MTSETINLSAEEARLFAAAAIERLGFDAEESAVVAAHLVESELMGYPALGLTRVLTVAGHKRRKASRSPVVIVHETPVSARLDGGNHLGMYVLRRAADIAIAKAGTNGVAVVSAGNAWLSCRNAYYLDLVARAGFVGFHFAASPPVVAPLGAAAPAFGTNPLAIGLPRQPNPFILDMATSATNHGDLMLASRLGQELPEGVAIDAEGQPTRDPVAALAGAILPFGGHKGSGLAFTIQALCLLGGAPQDFGYVFVVFDPALLVPSSDFEAALEKLIAQVKATPRQAGVDEIRVPGERAYAERARRVKDGIDLPRAIHDRIAAL